MGYHTMASSSQRLLFVVSGPSGVGKSTLCRNMLTMVPDIRLSVSCTTRSPREGETDGKEYRFISKAEFQKMIDKGEFVEWAKVYDQLYGTPWSEVEEKTQSQTDLLLDIDVQGARQVLKARQNAVSVFILPPSLGVLKSRLAQRGTDSRDEQDRRFQRAKEEMQHYAEYQYTILNETLDQAIRELQAVIMAVRVKTQHVDVAHMVQ